MCSPKYDIWLSNVVIVKSNGPEVENSSKSHGKEDVKFENKRQSPIHRNRKRTRVQDIVQFVLKQKWKWARHVARLDDNRWTQTVTE